MRKKVYEPCTDFKNTITLLCLTLVCLFQQHRLVINETGICVVTRPQSGWITAVIYSKLCYILGVGVSCMDWVLEGGGAVILKRHLTGYHINDLPRLHLYKVLIETHWRSTCSTALFNKTENCTFIVHVVDSGSVSSSVLSVDAKEFIPSSLPEPSYYTTDVCLCRVLIRFIRKFYL